MKNLAKRNFICFAILAVLLIALCFINIAVPATTSRFVGFVPAITRDVDINGGLASKYEITFDDSVTDKVKEVNATKQMLSSKLAEYGYGGASVSVGTNDNAYVEIPAIKLSTDVLNAIATKGKLFITTAEQSAIDETTAIGGDDVLDVVSQFSQLTSSSYSWGVNVILTESGKTKLFDMTADAATTSTTLNIYVGEQTVTQISVSGQHDKADLYFFGTGTSEDSANVTALTILMGKYNADFDMVNNEIISIAPLISPTIQTWITIVIALVIALILVLFFVKFGELGFFVALNLAFLLTLTAFLMQALPVFVLSYSGIMALMMGIVMFFISNMLIFKTAKEEYAQGKKIALSLKLGLKNNTLRIVDFSVVAIIISVVVYFVGGVYAQSFAFTLAITAALNLLTTLVFNKLFIKWYSTINKKKANKIRFTREEHISELD